MPAKKINQVKKNLDKDLKNKGSFYKDEYIDLIKKDLRKRKKK